MESELLKFLKNKSFFLLYKYSLKCSLKDNLKNIKLLVFIFILSFPLAINIAFSSKTIPHLKELIDLSTSTFLTIAGFSLTGFAIFQGLMSKEVMYKLLHKDVKEADSLLVIINFSNIGIIFLQVTLIFLNFILKFYLSVISEDWYFIYFSYKINSLISLFFLTTYLFINFLSFIEFFFFIYNMSQVFNINIVSNLLKKSEE